MCFAILGRLGTPICDRKALPPPRSAAGGGTDASGRERSWRNQLPREPALALWQDGLARTRLSFSRAGPIFTVLLRARLPLTAPTAVGLLAVVFQLGRRPRPDCARGPRQVRARDMPPGPSWRRVVCWPRVQGRAGRARARTRPTNVGGAGPPRHLAARPRSGPSRVPGVVLLPAAPRPRSRWPGGAGTPREHRAPPCPLQDGRRASPDGELKTARAGKRARVKLPEPEGPQASKGLALPRPGRSSRELLGHCEREVAKPRLGQKFLGAAGARQCAKTEEIARAVFGQNKLQAHCSAGLEIAPRALSPTAPL